MCILDKPGEPCGYENHAGYSESSGRYSNNQGYSSANNGLGYRLN